MGAEHTATLGTVVRPRSCRPWALGLVLTGTCTLNSFNEYSLPMLYHMILSRSRVCLLLLLLLIPLSRAPMNYIRGAVNVISAPYQYYKELPPINPSTLTGAIDVIVIQRPTDDGGTELACSPFHVRFGKWQVLRPGEKKVNVFVNGNPIPFNMKIGDAGEAFFVFETDDDIPADLITSPIIQPSDVSPDIVSDHFVLQQDSGKTPDGSGGEEHEEGQLREEPEAQEPEFLDLDAHVGGSQSRSGEEEPEHMQPVNTTPKQTYTIPAALRKSASRNTLRQSTLPLRSHTEEEQDKRADEALKLLNGQIHVPEVEYHHDVTLDAQGYHSGYRREKSNPDHEEFKFPSGSRTQPPSPPPPPHTQSMHHEMHPQTFPSSESSEPITFPSFRATSEPPPDMMEEENNLSSSSKPPLKIQPPQQEYSWEWGAFPQPSPMKASFGKGGRINGSGGGPLLDGKLGWEAKSMRMNKPRRLGGMHLPELQHNEPNQQEEEKEEDYEFSYLRDRVRDRGRSQSVPPELQGSPTSRKQKRDSRGWKEYEDFEASSPSPDEGAREYGGQDSNGTRDAEFGAGGLLIVRKDDPTKFILKIEGRRMAFQLSLVPGESAIEDAVADSLDEDEGRGRKIRDGSRAGGLRVLPSSKRGQDEVEATRLFEQGLVSFDQFLDDESILSHPQLVIRWVGVEQYVTRNDGSPLMDALAHWRQATLSERNTGYSVRHASPSSLEDQPESVSSSTPASPPVSASPSPPPTSNTTPSDTEEDKPNQNQMHSRSKSEPPDQQKQQEDDRQVGMNAGKKPTSLSWVQWWSRSRRKESEAGKDGRPGLTASPAPLDSEKRLPEPEPILRHKSDSEVAFGDELRPSISRKERLAVDDLSPAPGFSQITAPKRKFAKTLRLTSDQLKSLNLRSGSNTITFSLSASGAVAATARIFVWDSTDQVVISDIDGTITKSDGLGHVFAMIGRDWTHLGVAKLYTDITRNGYKIMYLTSRAIGQADATRDYLKGIKQNNYQLPEGPVIMSPDRLMASLHREVIMRKPEVFKMACLRDIQRLFGESARKPFYAGFGNRITDALSYRSVNVPSARIFTIDSTGEVKMELLELAGYKSSYIHMTDLVDQMFPPIHRKWTPEFTDFNYWKAPVQDYPLPDLSPPSPALSARSDTSNQSALARLRNFSLVGRQNPVKLPMDGAPNGDSYRNAHLRQMSSFERLSTTLGLRRSTSPESHAGTSSYAGSDDEDADVDIYGHRNRQRRRSMTSMPGSLDDDEMNFGVDEDDEEEGEEGEEGYDDEDAEGADEEGGEDAFDEDLLAAGEMQNVPFL